MVFFSIILVVSSICICNSLPFVPRPNKHKHSHAPTPVPRPIKYKKSNHCISMVNDYNSDIDSDSYNIEMIQQYKNFFTKENVNQLIQEIHDHKLSKLFISKDYSQVIGVQQSSSLTEDNTMYDKFHLTQVNVIEVPTILNQAYENNIPTNFIDFNHYSTSLVFIQNILNIVFSLAGYAVPIFIMFLIFRGFTQPSSFGPPNMMSGSSMNMINRNAKSNDRDKFTYLNVSLSSWAGSPEVLEECKEVVSYLDNKKLFEQVGAEMPKGILLEGPPGTGKTLLAKGIATETNSSFISISGAEFVELFVGMGAARVRSLFKNARDNTPCIIFIDEIDAIGKQRNSNSGFGSNDEREQTLNQILFEMDGFSNNEGILILAATNRRDILDKALLRPGRFDRIIKVPLPDKYSRGKILNYYCDLKQLEPGIDIQSLAEITDGFSGAELKNLVNEAAILTARQNKTIIGEKELYSAFEKLIVGLIRNNNDVSENTRLRVAIHESGHAIMALCFPDYFNLQKVSIQATYGGAGGYTLFTENPEVKEGGLYTRDFLKKRLIVTLGGKAAEYVCYKDDFVSVGAIQDLKQANQLAEKMIGNFGMGNALEVFYNENVNSDNTNSNFGNNKYSEYTKFTMDRESLQLVAEAYSESKRILSENKDVLMTMTELLLNKTILNRNDIPDFYL